MASDGKRLPSPRIQPLLARITNNAVASVLGSSIPYASAIRAGRRVPHPRHGPGIGGIGWCLADVMVSPNGWASPTRRRILLGMDHGEEGIRKPVRGCAQESQDFERPCSRNAGERRGASREKNRSGRRGVLRQNGKAGLALRVRDPCGPTCSGSPAALAGAGGTGWYIAGRLEALPVPVRSLL
jgi:hypothetical protein